MEIRLTGVPNRVVRVIKREAKRKGRNLNAEIVEALERAAGEGGRHGRVGNLRVVRKELERFAASLPALDDSAGLIRGDREG